MESGDSFVFAKVYKIVCTWRPKVQLGDYLII